MEAIWTPILTGCFGIVTTLLATFKDPITDMIHRSDRSVKGQWEGDGHDIEIEGLLNYSNREDYIFVFDLKQTGSRVSGTFFVKSDPTRRFGINRGKLEGDYFAAEYKDLRKGRVSHGRLFFHLDGTAQSLKGFFLGRQHKDVGIVFGNMNLTKKNE